MTLRRFILAMALAGASSAGAQTPTYDLIIHGGRVVDGTGPPSRCRMDGSASLVARIPRKRAASSTLPGWSWPPGSST